MFLYPDDRSLLGRIMDGLVSADLSDYGDGTVDAAGSLSADAARAMLARYIDMGLAETDGNVLALTPAGRHALAWGETPDTA